MESVLCFVPSFHRFHYPSTNFIRPKGLILQLVPLDLSETTRAYYYSIGEGVILRVATDIKF